MKKYVYIFIIVFVFGLFTGGVGSSLLFPVQSATLAAATSAIALPTPATAAPSVIDTAFAVCGALKNEDFSALSNYVHPDKGVIFVPYSMVDRSFGVCVNIGKTALYGLS